MGVITIEDDSDDGVSTLNTTTLSSSEGKLKRQRKSAKDKNHERVLFKRRKIREMEIKNNALKAAFEHLDYAARIKRK